MEPPPQSYFGARPADAPPSRAGLDEKGLAALRASLASSRGRFITVNAAAWSVAVGTPVLVGLASHPSVASELRLGILLFVAQCSLLLATSALLDRAHQRSYRSWSGGSGDSSFSTGGEAGHDIPR